MKKSIILLFGLLVAALTSCTSTKQSSSATNGDIKPKNDIENPGQNKTLIDYLRHESGVQIIGSGSNASIRIRGSSTLKTSNEPLFVVNGRVLNGGLSEAIQFVPTQEIKSVRVLKNADELSFYGARGANGVIEILTK
jgi:TonB-dependent SusC/RagA subfamily outer membrane receptor